MKVIDLLNKIAKGEELPNKIKYREYIFQYESGSYWCEQIGGWFDVEFLEFITLNDLVEKIDD